VSRRPSAASPAPPGELHPLFHRLNNQLGIVLAHAELLEAKAISATDRDRASRIVTSALDAMATSQAIRDAKDH
jgi:hypothetical protein